MRYEMIKGKYDMPPKAKYTRDEISEMLSLEFQGTLMLIKSGKFQVVEVKDTKE